LVVAVIVGFAGCAREEVAVPTPDQRAKLLTIPDEYKSRANPLPANYGNLTEGRARFEQYCALCHGPDGKGTTLLGRSLYPPAADLTLPQVSKYTDGQLYWIISEGIRFSGMPATRAYSTEEQIWRLVLHLRQIQRKQ
jgi:mono/diheme cytochrome c family protein